MKLSVLLLASACLCAGCIRPALPPAVDLRVAGLDTAALKGKTIIIDPGHGGPERGALAESGLCEAEVNLGVALYLWGLLKEAGANPLLTRSTDSALATEEPYDLRSDLEARTAFSNSRSADLFISIHHNSDGRERGRRNDLIIFFKLSDPGPSRDVAREVCATLQQQLQAEPATTQPGNYLVLRSSGAPAILGEASYMNFKPNSRKLAYNRTLAAEALGYFLGLLNYYAKGVPAIGFTTPAASVFATARPAVSATWSAGAPDAALDGSGITARLDGGAAPQPVRDEASNAFIWTPAAPLANGSHELCLEGRSSAGNAARRACLSFTVALPAARLTVKPVFPVVPADGQSAAPVDIEVYDRLGRPVLDGTPVALEAAAGRFDPPSIVTKNGRARAFLQSGTKPRQVPFTAKAGTAAGTAMIQFGTPRTALFAAEITDGAGTPVAGALLMRGGREVSVSDEAGRVFDSAPAGTARYTISRKGYEPVHARAELAAGKILSAAYELRQMAGGVFFNRTVMLDAEGKSAPAGMILRELQQLIEQAGGAAPLTGQPPAAPSVRERVLKASAAQADFFLSFAGGRKPSARHYYKSAQGALLAELACSALNERDAFGEKTCEIAHGSDYVLVHTPMPALLLHVPEKIKIPPRDAAQGLYEALAKMFQQLSLQPQP